jgi:hypothetical protein
MTNEQEALISFDGNTSHEDSGWWQFVSLCE